MYIAIDFETYLISASEPIPRPVCLSYYYLEGRSPKKGVLVGKDKMETFLKTILESNLRIIAHNMSFEALVIDEHFPKLKELLKAKFDSKQMICTKVYQQLLDATLERPLHRADLGSMVKKYLKIDISEDKNDPDSWRLRYSELDGVPLEQWPQKAIDYAIDDSFYAYKIYNMLKSNKIEYNLSVAADFYLNKMGLNGITIDITRVNTLREEIQAKLAPGYAILTKAGLVEKGKNGKYKKKMKMFREFIEKNVPTFEKTAKGTVATSSEHLDKYAAQLEEGETREVLTNYLDVMKYEKVLTAFISRLEKADPLVRTQYKAAVSSGRTSSSTSQNFASVNIQQMPRSVEGVTWDIRNCFVPREGFKFCSIDYNGLELSSTAHQLYALTGKHNMLDIINGGDKPTDMHSMLAYRIMNIKEGSNETYESFVKNKKKAPYSDYRQLAKPINLGFPGGIGYDTMRTLLARDKVNPKLVVLETSKYEQELVWKRNTLKKDGYPVRIRRTGIQEYQLIYDELVQLKETLFGLYPDLEHFLKEGHKEFLTGKEKPMKNEFGEWEKEPMYSFIAGDFKRDYCMYTQVCNGLLMQSPSAIGAKRAMVKIISKYGDHPEVIPSAFIHDEVCFEVKDNDKMYSYVDDIAKILIEEMQTVLTGVRIAVEAELFDYWKKAGGFWDKTYWKDPKGDKICTT